MRINLNPGDRYFNFEYAGTIPVSISPRSIVKLSWKCSCGNVKEIHVSSVAKGQKTCGDCNKIWLRNGDKLGRFTYVGDPIYTGPRSPKRGLFQCSCGKKKPHRINDIYLEMTKKCGRCFEFLVNPGDPIGKFTYDGTDSILITPGGNKKIPLRCRCGARVQLRISSAISLQNKTCGHCDDFDLHMGQDFRGFQYLGPNTRVGPGSHCKLTLLCKCGRICVHKVCWVTSGLVTGCGKCSHVRLLPGDSYMGFIYVGEQIEISKWKNQKLSFRCRCGNTKKISIQYITSGNSTTCGSCRGPVEEWYRESASKLASLKFPIQKEDIPYGGPTFLEDVKNGSTPTKAQCPVCKSEYKPRFYGIRRGISLTCGCVYNRISKANRDIASFIQSLGFETELEFRLEKFSYDVHPIGSRILIEYHGRTWHNSDYTNDLDQRKQECAGRNGYQLITILEVDWKKKRSDVLDVLCCVLGVKNGLSATN